MKSDFQLPFYSVVTSNALDCNILTGIYIIFIYIFFTCYQPPSSNVNLLQLNLNTYSDFKLKAIIENDHTLITFKIAGYTKVRMHLFSHSFLLQKCSTGLRNQGKIRVVLNQASQGPTYQHMLTHTHTHWGRQTLCSGDQQVQVG